MSIHGLILCGGSGTRLWPLSRVRFPKPFIPMLPGGALYDLTLMRAAAMEPASIIVVTARDLAPLCESSAPAALPVVVKSEPMGRNTLPATILGCAHLPDEDVMIMMPSDHAIDDLEALTVCLGRAVDLARQGFLVTLGIEPGFASTSYGYMQAGEHLNGGYVVQEFIEKPNADRADEMLAAGGFYWNSGIYIFRVGDLKDEVRRQVPAMLPLFDVDESGIESVYQELQSLSIDYGIAENARRMAMVPASFDWDDLGSWRAVWKKTRQGPNHIAVNPGTRHLPLDSNRILVHSDHPDEKVYVSVGVSNLAVIDTRDALVVTDLERSESLRKAWDQAKEVNPEVVALPSARNCSWGKAEQLCKSCHATVIRLVINPGRNYDTEGTTPGMLQCTLVSGTMEIQTPNRSVALVPGEPQSLPNQDFRFTNKGEDKAEIILILLNDQSTQ